MEVSQCETNTSPFHLMAGLLKVLTTDLLCPLLLSLQLVLNHLGMILPMEVAMVLRYTDLVELSQTILLALMLEILGVIPSTADTSVGVLLPSRVGSGVLV